MYPALLRDHFEQRRAPELVRAPHHVEVAPRDVEHAAPVDLERALRRLKLGEARRHLLPDRPLHRLALALRPLRFGDRRRDIALVCDFSPAA